MSPSNSNALTQLCLLVISGISIWSLITQDPSPIKPKAKTRPASTRKPSMRHCRVFRRRSLPYHLVLRCRRRKGNRPDKIFGPSRAELLSVRREKRRRYRKGRAKRAYLQTYEAATSEYLCPFFRLHEPDVDLLRPILRTLGPGGIPLNLAANQAQFELDTSNPSPNDEVNARALIFRAHEIERMLNTVGAEAGSVHTMPICFDTGASGGLTPFRSDFMDYTPINMSVSGVGGEGQVIGVGTTLTRVTCRDGTTAYVAEVKYHSTSINIRLSSPQNLTKSELGQALLKHNNIAWTLSDGRIVDIPIDRATNLPLIQGHFVCSAEEKEKFKSSYVHYAEPVALSVDTSNLSKEEKFEQESDIAARCYNCVTDEDNANITNPEKELLHWHHVLCLNMIDTQNLMKDQIIYDQDGKMLYTLPPVIPTKYKSTKNIKPENLPCCKACKLATAKTRSTGTSTSKPVANKQGILSRDKYEPGDMISSDQYIVNTPGRLLSGYGRDAQQNCYHGGTIFQDAASNLVRVQNQVSLGAGETVMGKTAFEDWIWDLAGVLAKQYHSDNGIFASQHFRDDCTDKRQKQTFSGVGAKHQNARAERTIQTISYWARHMMVHTALHWPADGADNIRLWAFAVTHAAWLYNRLPNKYLGMKSPLEVFTKCKSDHRDLLRAHVWGCPAFVLDAKLQDGKKIPKFNRRARMGQFLGFSDEHSTLVGRVRNLSTNHVSSQFHVVYDDKFSSIYNAIRRDDVQLEAIFSDLFQSSREYYGEDAIEEEICKLADQGTEGATDDSTVGTSSPHPQPELNDEWLTENEIRQKRDRIERHRNALQEFQEKRAREFEKLNSTYKPDYPMPGLVTDDECSDDSSDDDSVDSDDDAQPAMPASEGASVPAAEATPPPRRNPRRKTRGSRISDSSPAIPHRAERLRRGTRVRKPFNPNAHILRRVHFADAKYVFADDSYTLDIKTHPDYARCYTSLVTDKMRDENFIKNNRNRFYCTEGPKQPPSSVKIPRKKRMYKARLFRKKLREANQTLGAANWKVPSAKDLMHSDLARFVHFAASDCGFDGSVESLAIKWLHPLMLAAQSLGNQADNPNWLQAMNGPFAEEYWKAACIEVETLEKMEAWDVVEQEPGMNVLPSTWAFKCKRFPDGLIKKFKARFCARGDRQKEGIDYFETYAPVVQWTTIRLMLILECLLGLKSKQGDVTCAFLHAHLDEGEKVHLKMPQGFKQYDSKGREKVLSLNRSLYGLKQSPRAFWKYMVAKMEKVGMRQSDFDPCLFIGDKCIAVMYVDDLLMWSTSEENIRELALKLNDEGVDLEEEDDAAGFLGVKLTKVPETGQMIMTQEGLITRIIEALGLDTDKSTPRNTPCLKAPLFKDEDGDPASGNFSYASIVGMLLYLSGHSRPDIAYSVSQVARFTFSPKHSHEQALKLIGRYLLATRDKGLVLTPSKELNIDAYPDADFAGLWGYEDKMDPICVRSRTGYVINVANCPILWKSQLQSETATSTMMAEVIALSACCRELLPILDIVAEVGKAVGLPVDDQPKMHVRIHEDNAGALVLANTLPPQFTPASKHYAVKTHWFREQIIRRGIQVLKISTTEQLGDLCTKCLPQATFEYLRKKLMGW